MNAPSQTPADQKIGDRQTKANAAHRAARRGTPDPSKISPAAVRLAVADSKDLDELKKLLLAEGIEAEFDRRGQAQEIYGWRLRRQGAAEWLKASTLAKDLSWPKIAHRFAESDAADQIHAQPPLANAAPSTNSMRRRLQEPPAILQSILRPPANQLTPMSAQPPAGGLTFDMQKFTGRVAALDVGPVSKAMLLLGGAAINLSFEALKALLSFIKKVLAFFGIGLRPTAEHAAAGEAAPALGHEPHFLEAEAKVLPEPEPEHGQDLVDQAAAKIIATAEAIAANDPSLLPQAGDGSERHALVRALSETASATSGAAAAQDAAPAVPAPSLDDIFGATNMPAPAVAQQTALQQVKADDAIVDLEKTAAAYIRSREVALKSTDLTGRELLLVAMRSAQASYQVAIKNCRAICEREIASIQSAPLRGKLSSTAGSALAGLQVITTQQAAFQDLPALAKSSIAKLAEVRRGVAVELALLRHRQEAAGEFIGPTDFDRSSHDAPRG